MCYWLVMRGRVRGVCVRCVLEICHTNTNHNESHTFDRSRQSRLIVSTHPQQPSLETYWRGTAGASGLTGSPPSGGLGFEVV